MSAVVLIVTGTWAGPRLCESARDFLTSPDQPGAAGACGCLLLYAGCQKPLHDPDDLGIMVE